MKYTVEKSLSNFDFWSGGLTNASKLTSHELDEIESILESDLWCERLPSETDINDLFWFDFDWVCGLIGLSESEVDERGGV